MGSMELDIDTFSRRISRLYDAWVNVEWPPKTDVLTNVVCFMVAVGDGNDNVNAIRTKSSAFYKWLFGKQLNDTICVFTRFHVHILCGIDELYFLWPVERYKAYGKNDPKIKQLIRMPNDENSGIFMELLDTVAAQASSSIRGNAIGTFNADRMHGDFYESWQTAMAAYTFETIDICEWIECLLAVKDETELNIIQEACQISVDIFENYLSEHISEIIEAGNDIKHSELAAGVERALTDEAFVSNVDTAQLTMCYPPSIQSGGNFQLEYSAGSDDNYLQSGAIVCSLGVRYKSHCSNIARTLLIKSPISVQQNYSFVQDLERMLLINLVPGAKLNEIYKSVMEYAEKEKPHLVDHLVKTFGFAIGFEFDGSSLIIGPNCTAVVKANMVFYVSIGLNGLKDEDAKTYALHHSNTAIVKEFGPAVICTPPPYLKMIEDCWAHVFDMISPLEDVLALGHTCQHMNRMVGEYIDQNLPNCIRSVPIKCAEMIINGNIFFTIFSKFNENSPIQKQLNSLVEGQRFPYYKTLTYFNISLRSDDFKYDRRVIAVELNACTISHDIFSCITKKYNLLKSLAVNRCTMSKLNTSMLFSYEYSKLEHLKFVPKEHEVFEKPDQLKIFLEKHPKLKHFNIEINLLWANRGPIGQANIQLDQLTITIVDELNCKFPFFDFVKFLKRLHRRGVYKSLNFSLNCFVKKKLYIEMSEIPKLRTIPNIDALISVKLKELNIDTFSFEFRLGNLEGNPTERVSFCSAHIGTISKFIRHAKRLKIIKFHEQNHNY